MLAALASEPSELTAVLDARDTELMLAALRAIGVRIDQIEPAPDGAPVLRVTPPASFQAVPEGIDCGLAGTVMRFVPPLAALAGGQTRFYGDAHASQRPMAPLLAGLAQLGVASDADQLPFTLTAPAQLAGRLVEIDSSASSQFISALLLAAARFPDGIDLRHLGEQVPSLPHIQMSVAMLHDRGVQVDEPEPGRWLVAPGPIAAHDHRIEPDLTNAAVFLAAGVLSGGQVTVPGWPAQTSQPGDLFRQALSQFGAAWQLAGDRLTASATGVLRGAEIDLGAASELTPVVAALAAFAEGTTTISGVAHIRGHETDRLAAITAELTSLGVDATETADGLRITGARPEQLRPTRTLRAYADHRLAHLAALLGLLVPGIQLDDIGSVSKTMPDFEQRWQAMLAQPAAGRA